MLQRGTQRIKMTDGFPSKKEIAEFLSYCHDNTPNSVKEEILVEVPKTESTTADTFYTGVIHDAVCIVAVSEGTLTLYVY